MSDFPARFGAATASLARGDTQTAERIFRVILAEDPRAHPAWNALSIVALKSGDAGTAVQYALRAADLDRRNPLYLNNLGVAYGELGELSAAEKALTRALKLNPVYPEALLNLGRVRDKQGLLAEAVRSCERALAMGLRSADLCTTLAKMCLRNGSADRALAVLKQADDPQSEQIVPLIAACLAQLEGPRQATDLLRDAITQSPDSSSLHLTLSHFLLSVGEWREGWRYFQKRYRSSAELRPLPGRMDGSRVLLLGEQGLGDVLFFLRFAAGLASRGATMVLVCAPKLLALLDSDSRFAQIAEQRSEILGEVDREVFVGDLPALLEADLCPPSFALQSDPLRREVCRVRLGQLGPPPYLGLTWRAGLVRHSYAGQADSLFLSKELPPHALGEALHGWPGTLVCLQRHPDKAELGSLSAAARAPVHDLSSINDDLIAITALLDVLDEYVAVSNTNIHLLAGLGRRARVLVPYPPEWRWMRTTGPSAWFPEFPVYREQAGRGWSEALARLRADLFA